MRDSTQRVIEAWFAGLNDSDVPGLLSILGDSPVIRNAANPPVSGREAAGALLREFFDRTASRHFVVEDAAEGDGYAFAAWTATLTFRTGITIAGKLLTVPLIVSLRGIERFTIDHTGRLSEVVIEHETSSIPEAAQRQSCSTGGGYA